MARYDNECRSWLHYWFHVHQLRRLWSWKLPRCLPFTGSWISRPFGAFLDFTRSPTEAEWQWGKPEVLGRIFFPLPLPLHNPSCPNPVEEKKTPYATLSLSCKPIVHQIPHWMGRSLLASTSIQDFRQHLLSLSSNPPSLRSRLISWFRTTYKRQLPRVVDEVRLPLELRRELIHRDLPNAGKEYSVQYFDEMCLSTGWERLNLHVCIRSGQIPFANWHPHPSRLILL